MADKKVLLVDDEKDFREIVAKFFERRKIPFETAACCMEAIDWLAKDDFDVVVMDVKMPGLGGLECMQEIKKVRPELETIILTGHVSISSVSVGMKSGAFDYCLKPVDFTELFEKIQLAREKAARNRQEQRGGH